MRDPLPSNTVLFVILLLVGIVEYNQYYLNTTEWLAIVE